MSVEIVGCGLCGLTAVEMAHGLDAQQLRDHFGRVGPGLRRLLAEQSPFDLVLIMAGTNDLGMPQSSAEDVLAMLESMHRACWSVGMPSLALSVPESSVTGTAQYPEAAQKWHDINNSLAAWGKSPRGENPCNRPFFVNTAELVSFDNAARRRGLWDPDNLHFTAAGSREFGTKIAPLIAIHLREGHTGCAEASDSGHRQLTPERKTAEPACADSAASMQRLHSQQRCSRIPQLSPESTTCTTAKNNFVTSMQRRNVSLAGMGTMKLQARPSCNPLTPRGPPISYRHVQSRFAVY